MRPFSFFRHASRQSMESLLKEKSKDEPYSRSPSPSSSSSSSSSSASQPTWSPNTHLRRSRLNLLALITLFAGIVYLLYGAVSSAASERRYNFEVKLRTEQEAYVEPANPQKVYDWSEEPYLPRSASGLSYINETLRGLAGYTNSPPPPVEHTITVNPKVATLDGLPDHVDPEEIVFGFTSPYNRARSMCATWRHFLRHGSHCLIVLPKEEMVYKRDMEFYLQKEGLNCRIQSYDLGEYGRYEHRVMDMPRRMFSQEWTNAKGAVVKPKWFVVADDDTQILDMRTLQRQMSSRLHTEDHIVCAVTESKAQLGRHGRICYGGGGILLSASLAEKMSNRMGECLWWHHWRFGGDEMVTHCASTASSTPDGKATPPEQLLEEVVGLHQIDIPGDGSGVFQSGLPFISIHHWTGWLDIFPPWSAPDRFEALERLQKAADLLGGDNLFKRYVFDDGYTFMSLGYSITLYSKPLRPYEMQLMERTYRAWEHELRWPARPLVPEGKTTKGRYKTTYFLIDVLPEQKMMVYQNMRNDTIRVTIDI